MEQRPTTALRLPSHVSDRGDESIASAGSRFNVALAVETSKSFGRGLLVGIGRYAQVNDRWSLLVEDRGLDDEFPDWIRRETCDGLILRGRDRFIMRDVLARGIPTVCVGEDDPDEATAVENDDGQTGRLGAEHLLEKGFRRLAFAGIDNYGWSITRKGSFARFAARNGIECEEFVLPRRPDAPPDWGEIRPLIREWLSNVRKPVGVMACYDVLGQQLTRECRDLGIGVPDEIAILGVDNDETICELCDPPLTSVALDTVKIGFEAAATLDAMMRGESRQGKTSVRPLGVVERGSTDGTAVTDQDVANAMGYIRRFATRGIDVSDVVKHVCVSRRTLERRFKEQIGSSPSREIARHKLERVRLMLVETDRKLDVIARECGYQYTAHMIASFKAAMGSPPGEYRQNFREQTAASSVDPA
ncbi:MAG: DNA-binding transcriptional regulator [Planctomycetota bacterium]